MEKLEKHIKDKLGNREIKPSPGAWDKISSQLDRAVTTKSKRKYVYAIAAGFVGLLLASVFFFASSESNEPTQVVDENTRMRPVIPTLEGQTEFVDKNETESILVGTENDIESSQEQGEENLKMQSMPLDETEVASKQSIQSNLIQETDPLIAQKVNEVMAQVQLLESVNAEVTDAEVDSLLRTAQKEILTEKLFDESGSVDAMALLTEVEDELDSSFRDQIFDALRDGYFKLRTAVADRNN
ncbi:hypothetical protein [Flagellimonas algicola]|uniref:Uncharacterized protein n=1 Tax=Flagellimonas algicola TaxID=2583815 RepID=A0ABY2WH68_9FLAO|nr:hypothetical protein [Allomuricauda algicola]TMU50926.1 hypothetical protein FGG15_17025 [Allomuricauda algicola]